MTSIFRPCYFPEAETQIVPNTIWNENWPSKFNAKDAEQNCSPEKKVSLLGGEQKVGRMSSYLP